ncbi:hypothetical protein BGX31_008893 [Mortierella sp. GBA43]|nr:hypothetical protein BGX31_008893 [Mortierella sp. GBA43]
MVAQAGPVGVTGAGDGEAPGEKKPPVKAAPAGAPNPGPGPGTHAPGPNTNSHINNNNNGTHTNTTPTSGTAPKAAPSVKPARLSTCSGQQTTPCTISTQEAAPKAAEKPHHAPVSNSRAGSAVPASGEDVDANGDGIPDNKQDGPSGPAKKDAATGPGGFSMTTIMVGAGSVFALVAVLVGAVVVRKRRQRRARHTSGSLSGGVGGRGEPFDDEHYMSYSGGVKRMTNHPNTRSGSGLESPYSSKPSSTIGSTYGNTIGGNAKAERQPEQFWNP